jgi:hypothetical protein
MKKVYCGQCKYYNQRNYCSVVSINECNHPSNLKIFPPHYFDTPIEKIEVEESREHLKECEEINCNNDCPNFIQKTWME